MQALQAGILAGEAAEGGGVGDEHGPTGISGDLDGVAAQALEGDKGEGHGEVPLRRAGIR